MEVFLNALLIVAGFILLIKGADFLVEGASSLAKRYQLSEMMIGLTIVAFGTSSPELVVNLFSGVNGYDEVVFGNIIGSNIFNLFLILGLAGLIHPMSVQFNTVWKEIPFNIMVTIVLFLLVNDELIFGVNYNYAGNWDGLILLSFFGFFIYYVIKNLKKEVVDLDEIKVHSNRKSIIMVAGGMLALTFGGRLVVDNAVDISRIFDVSEKLIGLTIISAGTSLPELATSVVAALKKKADIAVGNILGSNIFNFTFVLGVTTFTEALSYDPILNIDLSVFLIGSLLLFFFMFTLKAKKLDRWEALILLIGFLAYYVFILIRK